jgi:hypothetical protein
MMLEASEDGQLCLMLEEMLTALQGALPAIMSKTLAYMSRC